MTRTKWMRLGVRDPADILRWAGAQNVGKLDDFRYRVIYGREFVSFRMLPRYAIEIGTREIIVVAHVKASVRQRLAATGAALWRTAARRVSARLAALSRRGAETAPAYSATTYQFAPALSSRR